LLLGRRRRFPSVLVNLVPFGNKVMGHVTRCQYSFRGIGATRLVQRRASRPWGWIWSRIRGRRLSSPELEQAGIIFRLERHGVRTARVLAFGQRLRRPWQIESFLLVLDQSGQISLEQWLADQADNRWTAELKQRWRLLRQAGTVLRRMHEACCYLPERHNGSLLVEAKSEGPVLVLGDVAHVRKRRSPSRMLAKRNFISLTKSLNLAALSRTDKLRLILSYVGQRRISASTRELVRDLEK
jgi:Lipopolysaccharide kinase (Kdo/WaaP) family